MKKINLLMLISLFAAMFIIGCDEYVDKETESPVVDASIEGVFFANSNPAKIGLDYTDLNFSVVLKRAKTSTATDISLSSEGAHAAYFDVPATVTFPSGEDEVTLNLAVKESAPQGDNLMLELVLDEAQVNPYLAGYPYYKAQVLVTPPCQHNNVLLTFTFDGYASETTWEIKDSAGEAVASGGPYDDGQATEVLEYCLEDGAYTITVNDAYGDGLTYPNVGSIVLTQDGEEILFISGDFGKTITEAFTLGN